MKTTREILTELLRKIYCLDALKLEQVASLQLDEATIAINRQIAKAKRDALEGFINELELYYRESGYKDFGMADLKRCLVIYIKSLKSDSLKKVSK